ncbi:PmeII family type II restriction endonuclease [Nitrosopumilus sp.]|uniref:PmeII family type II restriction endonuclease n=1 Tax=Nitrosopumilus sp. TaxID=2024843 RepID=UPI003D0A3741
MVQNTKDGVQEFLRHAFTMEKISTEKRISDLVSRFDSLESFKNLDVSKKIFEKRDIREAQRERLRKIQNIIDTRKDIQTNFVTYVYNRFAENAADLISGLTAEKMVEESSINPFLAKALGLDNFDDLARYFVVQTMSRSLVTSFGTVLEIIIRVISCGQKGNWWDVVEGDNLWSIKSGPNDMNKDQVTEFSKRAIKANKANKNSKPRILMTYGKKPHSVISDTLKGKNLDPAKYTATGKQVFELVTGDPNYHSTLLKIFSNYKRQGKTLLEMMDEKVEDLSKQFKQKYKNTNKLLDDTF